MPTLFSVLELAEAANAWCEQHGVVPANGQAGERITERNIRFYRARGLLDPPGSAEDGKRRGFTGKHACQLRVIRLLQSRAVPLESIRAEVALRTFDELQALERRELRRIRGVAEAEPLPGAAAQEQWQVTAVGTEFLLVSRRGRVLTEEQRRRVAAALEADPAPAPAEPAAQPRSLARKPNQATT